MPLLALNLFWSLVDALLIVALRRGVRLSRALVYALSASFVALVLENGLVFVRFHTMRAASYALFLHGPVVLALLAWHYRDLRARALGCAALALTLAGVGVDAFLYEPHALVISSYEVKAGTSVKVAVMSDFQARRIGPYERDVLAQLGSLDADVVLLAGDYIQARRAERAGVVRDFREAWQAAGIHPRLGTYAVRGDVEPDGWEKELFADLDVVTSDQTRTVVAGDVALTLLSLHDSANPQLSLPPVAASTKASIVLGHRPDFALGSEPRGLLVAGHTHGGQVQIPFFGPPMILSSIPRRWGAGGLFAVDDERSLLVTRGAGVEHADDAPELRFDCRPELVALTLLQ